MQKAFLQLLIIIIMKSCAPIMLYANEAEIPELHYKIQSNNKIQPNDGLKINIQELKERMQRRNRRIETLDKWELASNILSVVARICTLPQLIKKNKWSLSTLNIIFAIVNANNLMIQTNKDKKLDSKNNYFIKSLMPISVLLIFKSMVTEKIDPYGSWNILSLRSFARYL